MYAIETINLTKTFNKTNAVKDLNLKVPEGSIYGFIGDNGSGKSTTEKLICGLIIPTKGEIKLFGKPISDPKTRSEMGVLIENPACFQSSTVYQNLMMQALNLNVKDPKKEVNRVLELVSLSSASNRKFKECSLGMKQRIGVAQSLLGSPKLLILDEPINGLDADGMRSVRETLVKINKEEGVTILISSHILGELSKIATHYGIIQNGNLIRQMKASEMSEDCSDFVYTKTSNDEKALKVLQSKYAQVEKQEDGGIRIYDESESSLVSKYLFENEIYVSELKYEKLGLEEYYLQAMTENKEKK